jgi:hypothetical protein
MQAIFIVVVVVPPDLASVVDNDHVGYLAFHTGDGSEVQ